MAKKKFKLPAFLKKLPFFKPPEIVGMDIGSYSVKMVHLKEEKGKWSLLKFANVALAADGSDPSAISPQERKNLQVAALKRLVAQTQLKLKDVCTSVSGNAVIVRYVKFGKMTAEQLEKAIPFEAEPYIPFAMQDVNIGFQILGDVHEEGATKMETILVAAKKDIIQMRIDVLQEAGLRPAIIDVDSFAIENALTLARAGAQAVSEPQTALCVNIGTATTNISIVENGTSRVVRDIFVAGGAFSKAIQKQTQCDAKTAEAKKLQFGILATAEEKEKTLSEGKEENLAMSSVLSGTAKELLSEIQRSIDFYQAQGQERTVHKAILCGGGSQLRGLDKYLQEALRIPVEILNPLKAVATEAQLAMDPTLNLPAFAVATGLAVRKFGDTLE